MGKRKKAKYVNPKRERYAKFRKDKPSAMIFTAPELSAEEIELRRQDEKRVEFFLKRMPRHQEKFIRERDAKSKR
ncbi:hypothetical protein HYX09_04240 [Candidatus Woesearchaeota archaeon]|nr:hypothetical protein [Candidatus Woesearchaeota archaeon]